MQIQHDVYLHLISFTTGMLAIAITMAACTCTRRKLSTGLTNPPALKLGGSIFASRVEKEATVQVCI